MKNFTDDFWVNTLFAATFTGTLGFALGFFGPFALGAFSNSEIQSNLFATGCIGLIVGFVSGALIHAFKRPSKDNLS